MQCFRALSAHGRQITTLSVGFSLFVFHPLLKIEIDFNLGVWKSNGLLARQGGWGEETAVLQMDENPTDRISRHVCSSRFFPPFWKRCKYGAKYSVCTRIRCQIICRTQQTNHDTFWFCEILCVIWLKRQRLRSDWLKYCCTCFISHIVLSMHEL